MTANHLSKTGLTSFFKAPLLPLLVYVILAGIMLLRLPLQGSLPGNWDSWLYLALFNYYPDYVLSLLGNGDIYRPFFPEQAPPFLYGEPSFFNALLYLPFQWLTGSPLWGFYAFVVLVLALNAFALFLLIRQFSGDRLAAWIGGFMMLTGNYVLSSLDQQNVFSIYPALFSLFFMLRYTGSSKAADIYTAAVFAVIQLYCSGYHFFFLGIVYLVLALFHLEKVISWLKQKNLWLAVLLLFLGIAPYVCMYLLSGLSDKAYNPVDINGLAGLSLSWASLSQTHPYNLLYGNREDQDLLYYLHAVGPGLVLSLLALGGLVVIRQRRNRLLISVLLLTGLLLAVGPFWNLLDTTVSSPLYKLLHALGIDQFMRTPVRAFMITLVTAIILAAMCAAYISRKYYRYAWIPVLLFWSLENIPFRFQYFDSSTYLEVPEELTDAAAALKYDQCVWILPSSLFSEKVLTPGLGEVNREYIYMYWQTRFKKHMVNGMNGYVPYVNMEVRKNTVFNYDSVVNVVHVEAGFRADTVIYLPQMEIPW